ncbi:mitochondrial carrier protein-domain-containing protein [Sporodiniella umbellata]|nr:mitochondrial carrier protein-domain-containing protein [Sporodiniella umbellata]
MLNGNNTDRTSHPSHIPFLNKELLWTNKTVIAASSAAIVGVISGYPFDSVKTRLQTQHYNSITACVKQTYKEEGVRGFFRGIIILNSAQNTVY